MAFGNQSDDPVNIPQDGQDVRVEIVKALDQQVAFFREEIPLCVFNHVPPIIIADQPSPLEGERAAPAAL